MTLGKPDMLYFAPKDNINNLKPLGEPFKNSALFEEKEPVATTATSYSVNIRPPKGFWKYIKPQIKPYNLKYPNKKRKWRIQKKWFNRYEKYHFLGNRICVERIDGMPFYAEITEVKLMKGGCNKRNLQFYAQNYSK